MSYPVLNKAFTYLLRQSKIIKFILFISFCLGLTTATPNYNERTLDTRDAKNNAKRQDVNADKKKAYQEPWEWYDKCSKRQRNKGDPFNLT